MLTQAQEDLLMQNRSIRGRQLLLIIHKFYRTSELAGALYSIQDLQAVTLISDKHLEKFELDWSHILSGLSRMPDEDTLHYLYLPKSEKAVLCHLT